MGIFRTNDPTQFDDIDGIIIDETAPAPSIRGVAANIAILVGQFQRGSEDLTEVGSIGQFQELYGRSSFTGNKQLANKRFGRLKVIRAVAAAAVKATLTLNDGVGEASEVFTITTVADSSGSLNSKYLEFETINSAGVKTLRYLWLNVNAAGVDPAPAGRTGSEVAVATDDAANTISGLIQAVLDALTDLGSVDAAPTTTNTSANPGNLVDAADVNTGFTIITTVQGDGTDVIRIDAKDKGVYGNNITIEIATASVQGRKYIIKDNNPDAVIGQEVYDNLQLADSDAISRFALSQLIDATILITTKEPTLEAAQNLAAGTDASIADTDYENAIAKAAVELSGNFIFLDENNSIRNGFLKIHVAATQDKMTILAGGESDNKVAVIADVENVRDTDGRIIYSFPYVETVINGVKQFTNPCAWYASILSNTSPHLDPAFAENTQFLAGITSLKFPSLTRSDYINLMEAGVSAYERDPDIGFKIKSGVVTQILNSSKIMVFRRRMADFLTNSIAKFLKNYQNGVNALEKRDEVKAQILDFIKRAEDDKILPKDSEVKGGQAKLVDTDSLNTDTSVALGFFKIKYRQRIFSSMRFIVIQAEIGESVVVTEE